MASQSTIYNIPPNTLVPGPQLVIQQGSDGKCTATMDFRCRKFDVGGPQIQLKLTKGNSLVALYPEAGYFWAFLQLDSYTSTDEPGGITVISCSFKGSPEDGGFSNDNEASVVYTRNNALRDESIFNHPTLIAELSADHVDGIQAVLKGEAYLDGTVIYKSSNDEEITTMSEIALEWYDLIIRKGWETYPMPTSEWTKSATGKGSLTTAQLASLGKISTPPGNPYTPDGQTWVMTGATESLTVTGDGVNSYSITWTSGNWPEKIYT